LLRLAELPGCGFQLALSVPYQKLGDGGICHAVRLARYPDSFGPLYAPK
jgi:hypothetical protein